MRLSAVARDIGGTQIGSAEPKQKQLILDPIH
jgi:hypothetical protein